MTAKRRRGDRKAEYLKYLESPAWKRLRKQALLRDGGKCRGFDCTAPAVNVHHDRYPQVLGTEKLDWLFSVCVDCHALIHSLTAKGTPLPDATRVVLGVASVPPNVTVLPDDWRLSTSAARARALRGKVKGQSRKGKKTKKKKPPKGPATTEQILGLKIHLEKGR